MHHAQYHRPSLLSEVEDRIREPAKEDTSNGTVNGGKEEGARRDKIHRRTTGVCESVTQSRALLIIPTDGGDEFINGLWAPGDARGHARSRSRR